MEFRKSGFTDEDSAKLASIAEKYRNIADEEISAGDSASFIIAQMKAFNIEADQAEHIIDSVNEVANNFSVSSADLAKNLGNMSEIMAINNVSMEQQIGMLTGVTEITRNASSASRGLVMISSRLTQVLDESSSTGKKLTAIYDKLGIELKDENGQLKSHYEILGALAGKWNDLSENEQKYIALTSAGARQQQNFVALMDNWSQVVAATGKAYESMGSAQKENEKVMDSIAKKVEILKSQFQQLIIGKGGLQDFAKVILNIGIALLKFANSDAGKATIATTALVVALNLLQKAFSSNLITSIMATTDAIIAQIVKLVAEKGVLEALTVTVKAFNTALMESPLVMAGIVVAGIMAITAVMDKLIVTIDESAEKLSELSDTVTQTEQDLKSLEEQLKNVKDRIEELNNQESLSIVDEHELENLQLQSDELERHIRLKEQELEIAKKLAEEEAKRNLKTSGVQISSSFSTTQSKALEFYTDSVVELIEKQEELENQQKKLESQGKQNTKEYQNLTKEQKKLTEEITEAEEKGGELAKALQEDVDALTSTDESTKQLKEDTTALINAWLDATDVNEKYKHELESELDKLSEGGNVDLKLRPVVDTSELNEQGYNAGEGFATVFTHTFTNEANDLAINFTPIMTDENGQYLGVMQKDAFEQYCNDVVNGVHDDYKNLQIGVGFKKEDYDDFISAAEEVADKTHQMSEAYVVATGAADEAINVMDSYSEAVDELGEESEEADSIIKEFAEDLGISEEELIANAEAAGLSVDAYYECASAIKEADDAIDNFQSSISTLKSAMDEYNESQELSIDTVQSLLQLQPEYLAMLVEENGDLKLNEQAIVDKCNALIEERKQTALQMAYEKLAAIERSSNQAAAESESGAVYGNADALRDETSALSENTIQQYANRIARNDKAKGTAASQVVRELEAELKVLNKIGSSYKSISGSAKSAGRAGASGAKQAKDAQKDLNKELEETKKQYERVISWVKKQYDKKIDSINKAKDEALDAIEEEIDALEKEKDAALKSIEAQVKALEKQKEARQKYWDAQIDALKKANKQRKDALELQEKLDALERAKNTKVKIYKEGQGFVYDVDQTKVKEAQKELDEYLSEQAYEKQLERLEALKDAEMDNYDKRIDALNDFKDKVSDAYEEHIDALKEHKDEVEKQYDAEIELYENYKQQFEDMVNAYQDQQDALLAAQLLGIDLENDNWMTRLDNLQNFVNEYNRLQAQLDTGVGGATADTGGSGGGGVDTGSSTDSGTRTVTNQDTPNSQYDPSYNSKSTISNSTGKTGYVPTSVTDALGTNSSGRVKSHASGVGSVKNDEIAIVGENPNQEIVIGSKLNNGELMSLDKGTGVVNADSSSTLAGMLNQVGKFGASGFGSGNGTLNNNINNDSLVVNGVTIQGANISDPQTFVNGLLNLKAEAIQRAYRHR